MLYRYFRQLDTGKFLRALFTVDGEAFSVPAIEHKAVIASEYGIAESNLEVYDEAEDGRTGDLIAGPTVTATPTRQQELVAIGKDNWTAAQQKELIELLASK